MRKLVVVNLLLVFALVCLVPTEVWAQEKVKKDKAIKFDGMIVRQNTEKSTLDVKTKTTERTVVYNETTKWLLNDKPAEMSEFKQGTHVVVHGVMNDQGQVVAEKILLKQQ